MRLEILCDSPEILQAYKNQYESQNRADSGFDLVCFSNATVEPNKLTALTFGIRGRAVDGAGNPVAFLVLPRSSITKTPLLMQNSPGLIDYQYRGAIQARVRTLEAFVVAAGASYFQLVSPTYQPWHSVSFMTSFDETERGEGGFGSTNERRLKTPSNATRQTN